VLGAELTGIVIACRDSDRRDLAPRATEGCRRDERRAWGRPRVRRQDHQGRRMRCPRALDKAAGPGRRPLREGAPPGALLLDDAASGSEDRPFSRRYRLCPFRSPGRHESCPLGGHVNGTDINSGMSSPLARWLVLVAVFPFADCVQTTAPTDTGGGLTLSSSSGRPIRLSYAKDLEPVFTRDCVSCHNTSSPAGGYSMTDYIGVMKAVRPGDPSSPLVMATQPPGHMFAYFSGDPLMKSSLVYMWVVEYDADEDTPRD
jgi:hypothetical protein